MAHKFNNAVVYELSAFVFVWYVEPFFFFLHAAVHSAELKTSACSEWGKKKNHKTFFIKK